MSKIWKWQFNKWTQIGKYNKKDNLHNNTSAGTVLQAIKGERTVGLLSNVRWPPTIPRPVFSVRNSSDDDTTPPAIAVVPDFTSRRSPESDHFTNVVVQLLRCRLSRPPRVSTDVTQRRRDDNLQVILRASPRVLCSKLHYLRLCNNNNNNNNPICKAPECQKTSVVLDRRPKITSI